MNPIASIAQSKDHLTVFGRIFGQRLSNLPLQVLLVNCMETVPESALDTLADQFHITGYEGWRFASTVDQKRAMLKTSILLHAKKGTPWSMKEICRIAGYPGVYFQEGVGYVHDGTISRDGFTTHGSEGWARFKAFVPISDPVHVPPSVVEKLTRIINEYKPARCILDELVFVLS